MQLPAGERGDILDAHEDRAELLGRERGPIAQGLELLEDAALAVWRHGVWPLIDQIEDRLEMAAVAAGLNAVALSFGGGDALKRRDDAREFGTQRIERVELRRGHAERDGFGGVGVAERGDSSGVTAGSGCCRTGWGLGIFEGFWFLMGLFG